MIYLLLVDIILKMDKLYTAALSNDTDTIKKYLKYANAFSINWQEIMSEAIHHDNIQIVQLIYSNIKHVVTLPNNLIDFSINTYNFIHNSRNIIYLQHCANIAACYGKLDILKWLLYKSQCINLQEVFNWAASECQVDVIQWMHLRYLNIRATDAYYIIKCNTFNYNTDILEKLEMLRYFSNIVSARTDIYYFDALKHKHNLLNYMKHKYYDRCYILNTCCKL